MIKVYVRRTNKKNIDESPLDLIRQGANDNPNWTIDKEVYSDPVGNGGNKLTELYISVDNPVNGEKSYFSFWLTSDSGGRVANRLYFYVNTGFDSGQSVDNQPGKLSGVNGTENFEYDWNWYGTEYTEGGHFKSNDEIIIVTDTVMAVTIRGLEYLKFRAYFGVYNLHFNIANSGTFVHSNNASLSKYYFRYGNIWYGDAVATDSIDGYQGRIDVDKAPYAYHTETTPYGNIQLFKQTVWINDDNTTNNASFSCVGYIDVDVANSPYWIPQIFHSNNKVFSLIPIGDVFNSTPVGIYYEH